MTVPVPLKVGEILTPKSGMWTSYSQLELKARLEFKNKTYWALALKSITGAEWLDTLSEEILRSGWVRKSTFFSIGKTYGFKKRDDTWKVLDLYHLDNGVSGNTKRAVALLTYGITGHTDIQTLTENDFSRMVEV